MQKTYAQLREEMKARIAAYTEAHRAEYSNVLRDGNREYCGHYTFDVCQSSEGTDIVVRFNGRRIREVNYRELHCVFACNFGQEMTPSLLKALIETFVTFGNTNSENSAQLNLHRAHWWHQSRWYADKSARDAKWSCPFGV